MGDDPKWGVLHPSFEPKHLIAAARRESLGIERTTHALLSECNSLLVDVSRSGEARRRPLFRCHAVAVLRQ